MASAMKRYGACIVNIFGETSNFEKRPGAEWDQIDIESMMQALNFTCINDSKQVNLRAQDWDHRKSNKAVGNKTRKEFCCILCSIKSKKDTEYFLLAVSSHGREITEPEILFSDGKYVKLSEIIEALSDENCESLKDKPRIILLQACRSDPSIPKEDRGISIQVCKSVDTSKSSEEDDGAADNDMEDSLPTGTDLTEEEVNLFGMESGGLAETYQSETGSGDYQAWDSYAHTLPAPIDIPPQFLIVHATTAGLKAYRKKRGSWLFTELSKAVQCNLESKKEGQNINFLSIVTEASRKIGQEYKTEVFKDDKDNKYHSLYQNGQHKLEIKTFGLKSTVCLVHTLMTPLIFKHLVTEKPLSEPILSTIDMCLPLAQPALF